MIWTDDKIAELLRLKRDGFSHSQIARKLGCETRNMISGKLWRIEKRKRKPGSKMGRPIGGGNPQCETKAKAWDSRTFAPYSQWKAERQKERELGLR